MTDVCAVRFPGAQVTVGLLAVVMGVGTLGCFGRGLPARELYRLTVPAQGPGVAAPGPLTGALEVTRYETPGLYSDGSIVFRTGENEYGVYSSREWAMPLGEMLALMAESALERTPLTTDRAVYDPPPGSKLPYVWRGSVREFEEVNRGKQVFVAVRLDVQVVRAADDVILWKGSSRLERGVARPTMPMIVAALSALANEATETLIGEARAALATNALTPAATSQSPR